MGMGYGSNWNYVIENEQVQHLAPEAFNHLTSLLEQYRVDLNDLARVIETEDPFENLEEEEGALIHAAYRALCEAFHAKTGINLYLGHHDSENVGSCYDEVDGGYFALKWDDIMQFTPQAQALIDQKIPFELKTWVTYG